MSEAKPYYELSYGNLWTKPLRHIIFGLARLRLLSIDRAADILTNHVMRTKKIRFMGRGRWVRC